ncbi:MAG: ABC transporter permease [Anaerohalosphaera sp.]|nr:ABC transporter permease [Anaerohalosphaera sp.]
MKAETLLVPFKYLNPSRITGPIFEKELRVSSRRKRNYVLRFVYLAILLITVLLIWKSEVRMSGNVAFRVSRLSRAGLTITGIVVLVQFFAAQILAVIMLSNSISDEVYHKTLGALMSTPINSFQIVMGKLLSKLLQIALLICLTLPILGIVRVFGGVPWDYLLKSLCVTLTAVIFAGMLSLNISINHKHAYVVIIQTVLMLFLLYILLPWFGAWISYEYLDVREIVIARHVALINPFFLMMALLEELFRPGNTGISLFGWGWHCLYMLAFSGLLFLRAIIVVRKKALLQACGQVKSAGRKWKFFASSSKGQKIRRVKGQPLLWKELRKSSFKINSIKTMLSVVFIIGCLLFSYYMGSREKFLDDNETHIAYCMLFLILGVFVTTVFSATTITSEKVSRSLPVLLTTLITDWQIIRAKTLGVFRRTIPVWSLLFVHITIFILLRYIHPSTLLQVAIIVFGATMLVVSSGIFFSSMLKNTTSAVIANIIFAAVVWAGIPLAAMIIGELSGMNDELFEFVIAFNPFFHIGDVMDNASGSRAVKTLAELDYNFLIARWGYWGTTTFLAFTAAVYAAVGMLFLTLAKGNLRRKIF